MSVSRLCRVAALIAVAASAAAGATTASEHVAARYVAVPPVRRLTIDRAYARLVQAGLRVSFAARLTFPADETAIVTRAIPPVGTHVRRGAVVRLVLVRPPQGVASPGVPIPLPSAVVPNLVGKPVGAAAAWARRSGLTWEAALPPLVAGAAPQLLDDFRVVHQSPKPGTRLSYGVSEASGSFLVTPLRVRGLR
jgi:beta-lactam-binding protein with PASTA domain